MKVGNIIAGLSLCLVAISFAGCPMSRTPEETRKSYITDIETPGGCIFGSNDMLPVKEFILVRLSKYDLIHYDPLITKDIRKNAPMATMGAPNSTTAS